MRERRVLGRGHDLDGAGGDPAVAAVCPGVRDRIDPGQGIQRVEQGLAVLLDRQDELPAVLTMNSAVAFTVCKHRR